MGRPATHDRLEFAVTAVLPRATSKEVATRRRHSIEYTVATMQDLLNRFGPDELETIAARVQQVLTSPTPPSATSDLIQDLVERHEYSEAEQVTLEVTALLRSFSLRKKLLEGALTAPQVARILGTSRQTPHDRVRSGTLLAILDNGLLRFPPWQFDPEGPDHVVPELPAVLRTLQMSPLAKANWLTRSNPYLEGRTPLAALKQGDIVRVVDVARAAGVT